MYAASAADKKGSRLEILMPTGAGPIQKFIDNRRSGIHHIALRVDNLQNAIDYCIREGIQMIDTAARPGAHQTKVAFVHPKSTGGILFEFVEET